MKARRQRPGAIGAAVIVASLTLGAFAVLQDYGPESCIRRFHSAVANRDPRALQRVTEQPITSPDVARLSNWVNALLRRGARPQLLRMDRQRQEVYAAVVYWLPNGESYPTVWVVEKQPGVWKVDARRTLTILEDGWLGL